MKKLSNSRPFSFLSALLHRITFESTNGNFLWRVLLGCVLSAGVVIGIFAWLLYGDVTAEPLPLPTGERQTAFSLAELEEVINLYQKKEEDHKTLLHSSPETPSI